MKPFFLFKMVVYIILRGVVVVVVVVVVVAAVKLGGVIPTWIINWTWCWRGRRFVMWFGRWMLIYLGIGRSWIPFPYLHLDGLEIASADLPLILLRERLPNDCRAYITSKWPRQSKTCRSRGRGHNNNNMIIIMRTLLPDSHLWSALSAAALKFESQQTGMSCWYLGSMDALTSIKVGWIRPISRWNNPTY